MNSNKRMVDRSYKTDAANVLFKFNDVTRADRAMQRARDKISATNSAERARLLLPTIPAIVSHAIHARKESWSSIPLDSGELARNIRRKERFSGGDRWERQAETTAMETRWDESKTEQK